MSLQAPLKPVLSKKESNQGSTKVKSVFKKEEKIDLDTFKNLNAEFSLMTSYLSESFPQTTTLPFQGTWLEIMKNDRYYAFVSREGTLAVIDSHENVIIKDECISKGQQLWTVGISGDEKHLFVAGENPIIKKYTYDTLKLVSEYQGHSRDVNSVIISPNDDWMISCSDDSTVRFWSLNGAHQNKILYSQEGSLYSMDLSSNNTYIITGSGAYTAVVYELAWELGYENGRVLTTISTNAPIWAVKISYNNSFVVTGDQMGEIVLYEFGTWRRLKSFNETTRIRSIDISKDERTMVTAGEANSVVIWHLEKESNEPSLILKGHTKMIKSAVFTPDQNFIVSLADDNRAIRWKIPYFEQKTSVKNCQSGILFGVNDTIVCLNSDSIDTFDSSGIKLDSSPIPTFEIHLITPDNHIFLIQNIGHMEDKHEYKVLEYNLATPQSPISQYTFTSGLITSATISSSASNNLNFLCIGQLYKINTYKIEPNKLTLYNSQLYHDREVCRLTLTPDNLFLFSAGTEGVIKKIDTIKMADPSSKNVLCKINDYSGEIYELTCTTDSAKLIILSENYLTIWSISQEALIKRINLATRAVGLVLSKLYPYFYLRCEGIMEVWSFQDFEFKTKIDYPRLNDFCFFSKEQMIAVRYSDKTELFESPLYSKHVKILGEEIEDNSKDFFKYVHDIVAGKNVYYDDRFKNWIIMPFMMNIQHIYAYYNYDDLLRCAFVKNVVYKNSEKMTSSSIGDAPYLKSAKGHTVLSIALEQDFPECTKIALKCLRSRWSTNPYSLVTVSDSLIALNNSGIDGLHKLYDFALRKHFFKTLPSFCSSVSLPVIKYSESIEVDYDVMLGVGANTKDGTALAFDHSCFKVIMTLGSEEGIDFLESLINSPNERIFETRFVRLILQEKWKRAKYVMYLQAALYVSHIITLAVFSTLYLESKGFIAIPFGLNICLLLYEIYQMFAGGLDYFKDMWNYVDMIRSSLFFIYTILVWVDYFSNQTDFLALIILITWIRGVTYFRIFDSTRYLINLIFEVFNDIPSFLIVFFYTILAFSFIFYALDSSGDYYSTFVITYSTTLGNSDTSNYDKLQWLFYLFITLFNFIIMLNLLISILSDTYARVNEMQMIADGKELASMVMEVEMMMFWRKTLNKKEFVHVCRDESNEEIVDSVVILGKFKAMNLAFGNYESKVENSISELERMKGDIAYENDIINDLIRGVTEKYKLK